MTRVQIPAAAPFLISEQKYYMGRWSSGKSFLEKSKSFYNDVTLTTKRQMGKGREFDPHPAHQNFLKRSFIKKSLTKKL